jgi:hypothetical protein
MSKMSLLEKPLRIHVTILQCENLANADRWGKSDPYVIVSAFGEEVFRTNTIDDTLDPVYTDQVAILKVDEAIVSDLEALLTVLDHDVGFKEGEFLGQAKVELKTLLRPPEEPFWLDLGDKPNKPSKVKVSGRIQVKVWVENPDEFPGIYAAEYQEAENLKVAAAEYKAQHLKAMKFTVVQAQKALTGARAQTERSKSKEVPKGDPILIMMEKLAEKEFMLCRTRLERLRRVLEYKAAKTDALDDVVKELRRRFEASESVGNPTAAIDVKAYRLVDALSETPFSRVATLLYQARRLHADENHGGEWQDSFKKFVKLLKDDPEQHFAYLMKAKAAAAEVVEEKEAKVKKKKKKEEPVVEMTEIQEIQLLIPRCKELSELASTRCSEYEALAYQIEQLPEMLDTEKKAAKLEELIELMTDCTKDKDDLEDGLDQEDGESSSEEEEERATDLIYKEHFADGTFNDHPFHKGNYIEYVPATLPIHMYKKLKELCEGDVAMARGYIEYIIPEIDDEEIKERLLDDLRKDGAFDNDEAQSVDEDGGKKDEGEGAPGAAGKDAASEGDGDKEEAPKDDKEAEETKGGEPETKDDSGESDLPDHLKPKEPDPADGRDLTKYRTEAIKRCEDLAEIARTRAAQFDDLVMDFESELESTIDDLEAIDYVSPEGFAEWLESYAEDIEEEMVTMEDYVSGEIDRIMREADEAEQQAEEDKDEFADFAHWLPKVPVVEPSIYIHVVRATGIQKATFGMPLCKVFWNEDEDEKAIEVGRTAPAIDAPPPDPKLEAATQALKPKKKSLKPGEKAPPPTIDVEYREQDSLDGHWESVETFLLPVDSDYVNSIEDCKLCIECWTPNAMSSRLSSFHGQVMLEGQDLLRQCYRVNDTRRKVPIPFRLGKRIGDMSKKVYTGRLYVLPFYLEAPLSAEEQEEQDRIHAKLAGTYESSSESESSSDEESMSGSESESGESSSDDSSDDESVEDTTPLIYKFQVLSAQDLAVADTFGKSDPYCVVKMFKPEEKPPDADEHVDDLHPEIPTEKKERRWEIVLESKPVPLSLSPVFRDVIVDVPEDLIEPTTHGEPALEDQDVLVVDLYDHDKVGQGDFLGQVRFSPKRLREMVAVHELFDLKPEPGLTRKDKGMKLVQGHLHVCGHRIKPRPRFELDILQCADLAMADTNMLGYAQASDPFCMIFWDGHKVGITEAIKNTCHPRWKTGTCNFELPLTLPKDDDEEPETTMDEYKPELRIEVWDMDPPKNGKPVKGDFLGQVVLTGPDLLRPGHRKHDKQTWYLSPRVQERDPETGELRDDPTTGEKEEEDDPMNIGGTITFRLFMKDPVPLVKRWLHKANPERLRRDRKVVAVQVPLTPRAEGDVAGCG